MGRTSVTDSERRTVGNRGQLTIPKSLRERLDIQCGDEVIVSEESGTIVVEKPVTREELAEGYRRRADRTRDLAAEMGDVSHEADRELGEAPDR